MLDSQKRYGQTSKKMVSLTHEGRKQIQKFANAHDMSFSAAIETMALIGMKADLTDLLIPLLKEITDKALQRNFNRMAKLGMIAAFESALAHDLIRMILLQLIRQEAVHIPNNFEDRMVVSYDPEDELDSRIRALYEEMRELASRRAQRIMRTPVAELSKVWEEDSADSRFADEESE